MLNGRAAATVLAAVLLVSCDGGTPAPPDSLLDAHRRLVSPSAFLVIDSEGNWACVMQDEGGKPKNIVAGLATVRGGETYPKLPRDTFGDPLEVPIRSGTVVSVPARSDDPLLLVTMEGYKKAPLPRPLPELAEALWNSRENGDSIRRIVTDSE